MLRFGRQGLSLRPQPLALSLGNETDARAGKQGGPLIFRRAGSPKVGAGNRSGSTAPRFSRKIAPPKNNVLQPQPVVASDKGLSAWDRLQELSEFDSVGATGPASSDLCGRHDSAGAAFDLLRTRLLHILDTNNWTRVAITAPTPGCGSTFCAVNLAQSMARIPGSRIVLMDLNQRNPGVAAALGLDAVGDMSGFLSGRQSVERHIVRIGPTLAVGLADTAMTDGADLLNDPNCRAVLDSMGDALRPDVVLYDLPPMLAHDELEAVLPQVDGVLLVADGFQTSARTIQSCERRLQGRTELLGVILNRSRSTEPR